MKEIEDKVTPKQELFCLEYIKDYNGYRAAVRAGYAEPSARMQASRLLTYDNIKARISELEEIHGMGKGEVKTRLSNIGRGNMADYFTEKLIPFTPQIKIPLAQYIESKKEYISQESEFMARAEISEEELNEFLRGIKRLENEVLRLTIELERNPNAFRIIDGPTEMIKENVLDLQKIIEDKERGIIKSVKHTKDGVQVEMYDAKDALTTTARMHGMLVDKSEVDLTDNRTFKIGYAKPDN